jgi:hypothetical protein
MRILYLAIGAIAGLAAAELTVRLVTSPELDFQSFSRPGIYCYDTDTVLNIVPACADASLMMRVPGEDRYIPTKLNRWGFRGPYFNYSHGDRFVKRVLVVGGMSQSWGAGLPDSETIAAQAAEQLSCGSAEIHTVAMPGAGAEVTWDVAERRVISQIHVDHVVLGLYERLGHPDIAGRLVPAADRVADLAALNGLEFKFSRRIPRFMRQSAVIVRIYDMLARAELELKWWEPRLSGPSKVEGPKLREQESFAELVREIKRRSEERGAAFSVLLLPWHGDTSDSQLRKLSPDVRFIDAHTPVRAANPPDAYFPDGHYKLPVTRMIGRMLADEICAVDFKAK